MYLNSCTVIDLGDGTAVVRGRCSITKRIHTTCPLPRAAVEAYRQGGGDAQTLFPTLSHPEREFLISGVSPEGWRTGVLGLRPDSYGESDKPEPVRAGADGKPVTVVIDRERWARARRGVQRFCGRLFDGEYYDCLGFYCQQVHGVSDDELLDMELPAGLGIHDLGDRADRLALLNDFGPPGSIFPWTDGAAQEAALEEEFAKLGITVEFSN